MPKSPPQSTAEAVPRPTERSHSVQWRGEVFTFLLAGLLCCAALIWIMQLWRADLRVPTRYGSGGDLNFQYMLAKDIVDHGWYFHNPRLGAPAQQDLRDFPMPDLVTFVPIKVMSWFTSSWGAVVDLDFFAGFLLATWSALAVMRHFGIARAPAILAAVLFAFAPYHLYRGEGHLQLSAYFVIPLAGLLMLWIMSGERLFRMVRRGRFLFFPVPSRKGVIALAACALLGSDGAYYGFFTILLLLGAGMYRAFEGRSFHRAGVAALLAGLIVLVLVLNLSPNIVHVLADGKNPEVATRSPIEAEGYALKMTQLVMPIPGHRIPLLSNFKVAYNNAQPWGINESDTAALGAFATAGFCFLLLSLVAGYAWQRHGELIHHLSLLNLGAFLIGTMGGIGALIAWTVMSQIRCYNRISIFISFFSVMAVAAVLDEIWRRWARTAVYRWIFGAVLLGILAAGLLDQVAPGWVPPYEFSAAQYRSDSDFIAHAESWLPHGTMILELPILGFPEVQAPKGMIDYDPVVPYLHSTTLRFSYGAIRGRYWGMWQSGLAALPPEDVVDAAAVAGFGAIYIDRNGYADRGAAIGSALTALGLSHIEARNGRFWLYDIRPYAVRIQADFTPANWAHLREGVLHPVVLQWLPQCWGIEGDAQQNWHWCGNHGGFQLENSSTQTKKLDIHAAVAAAIPGACSLHVEGPGWAQTVPMNGVSLHPLAHTLAVPPGTSIVRLTSDCPRLMTTDPRLLVFRIDNFRAGPAAAPTPELTWSDGFYGLEKNAGDTWHWCASSGELVIQNPGPASENTIRMIVASSQTKPSPLSISGPGFAESVTISPAGAVFSKRFVIPQGSSVLHFSSPAAPLVSKDPRKLVFLVKDLRLGNSLAPAVMYK